MARKVGDYIKVVDGLMDTTNGKLYQIIELAECGEDVSIIDDAGERQLMALCEYEFVDTPPSVDANTITVTLVADTAEFEASLDRILRKLKRIRKISKKLDIALYEKEAA